MPGSVPGALPGLSFHPNESLRLSSGIPIPRLRTWACVVVEWVVRYCVEVSLVLPGAAYWPSLVLTHCICFFFKGIKMIVVMIS